MSSSITYTLASGMIAEMDNHELISKNLAGANIPGFKQEYVFTNTFTDQFESMLGEESPDHLRGAVLGETLIDFSQGPLKETGRSLDFAIMGEGFFEVATEDGQSFYTRNGAFFLSHDREIVTSEGLKVQTSRGKLKFNKEDNIQRVQVCEDGSVRIIDEWNNELVRELGKLKVTTFEDPQKLVKVSGSLYMLPEEFADQAAEANEDDYQVTNFNIETSNFSTVMEMTKMVVSLRTFEMQQRMLKMRDGLSDEERRAFMG